MNEVSKEKKLVEWLQKHKIGIAATVAAIAVLISLLIFSNPQSTRLQEQLDLGNKYLEEMNYEEAVVAFKAAIEIEPMSVEAYLGLAEAYVELGDTESALAALEEGYELTGDESLQKEIERLQAGQESVQMQGETEAQEQSGAEEDTVIEIPFGPEDFKFLGYDILDDHFDEFCEALSLNPYEAIGSCKQDLDSFGNDGVMSASFTEDNSKEITIFSIGHFRYYDDKTPSNNGLIIDRSIEVSVFDDENPADIDILEYMDFPINVGDTYEDWCQLVPVDEIKEKGLLEGYNTWRFDAQYTDGTYGYTVVRYYFEDKFSDGTLHCLLMLQGSPDGYSRDISYGINMRPDGTIDRVSMTYSLLH